MELVEEFKTQLLSDFEEQLKKTKDEIEIQQIVDKFNNLDLQRELSDILEDAAKYNVEHVKSNMFQRVIVFRAEEKSPIHDNRRNRCLVFH